MSLKLLKELNGGKAGEFNRWLNARTEDPRVCWYPSAGQDFRDLLYLSRAYSTEYPGLLPDPEPPELFLHTDYFPWTGSTFLDSRTVHLDDRTGITVESIEELPRCDLTLDDQIVDFPQGSVATGRVIFMWVRVESDQLGEQRVPVIYAFVENAAFCSDVMLPNAARISHLVHVRYGGGCGGGGQTTGDWLLNVLDDLGVECLVTDGHLQEVQGEARVRELFPNLIGEFDRNRLNSIRTVDGAAWSGHGDVNWYQVARPGS